MNKVVKIILALLLMAAVLVYTVYNYTAGSMDRFTFFVYVAIKTKKDSKDSENNMSTEFSAGYDSDID